MEAPCVLRHASYTAILLAIRKGVHSIIEMQAGELVIDRLDGNTFAKAGWQAYEYPLARAVQHFLQHPAGVSKSAENALHASLALALPPCAADECSVLQEMLARQRETILAYQEKFGALIPDTVDTAENFL